MTLPVRHVDAHAHATARGARGHVVIAQTPAGWTVSRDGTVLMDYDACINTPQEVEACARRLRSLGYTVEMRQAPSSA